MKKIPLNQGKFALVDDEDFEWLSQWKWFLHIRGYAYRGGGRVLMHRVIAGAGQGQQVDHKNRIKLDNRKANLRVCTASQNQGNSLMQRNNSSGYKGVTWRTDGQSWMVRVTHNGTCYYLGRYKHIEDAARAYNDKALELWGEFAQLNQV